MYDRPPRSKRHECCDPKACPRAGIGLRPEVAALFTGSKWGGRARHIKSFTMKEILRHYPGAPSPEIEKV
jgi:hypothetical protein